MQHVNSASAFCFCLRALPAPNDDYLVLGDYPYVDDYHHCHFE